MREADETPAPGKVLDGPSRFCPFPGNEEEKSADESPPDDPADDDRDEDCAHHDDELLTVEPEDLDRAVQVLGQTLIQPSSPLLQHAFA